jgi:hemerythrin-like domain-containing protein
MTLKTEAMEACRDLRAAVYADEKLDVVERYRTFEKAVNEHFDVEERELLPAYAEERPIEARRIRLQHRQFRDQLYRLGVEAELHRVAADQFESLIATFQNHMAFEETTLYSP